MDEPDGDDEAVLPPEPGDPSRHPGERSGGDSHERSLRQLRVREEREPGLLEPPHPREVGAEPFLVEHREDVHAEVRLQHLEPLALEAPPYEDVAGEEGKERDAPPPPARGPVLAKREVERDAPKPALASQGLLLTRADVGHPPRPEVGREVEEVLGKQVRLALEDRHARYSTNPPGKAILRAMPPHRAEGRPAPPGLLGPLGALVALSLPFFLLSLASAEATRELKLAGQAAGSVLVLAGLALAPRATRAERASGAALAAASAFAAFLALFAVSFAAGLPRGRDPFDAIPLLSALALFAWGASAAGERTSERALAALVACGAITGALAALQRFTGLFRLPVEAPEPRFLASALIGNPGDVGASLVIPTLLALTSAVRGRGRVGAGLAFLAGLAGLSAASTFAPLAAFGAGAALLVALEPRRRLLPAAAVALVAVVFLAASGLFDRAATKLVAGDLSTLTTQREIGVLSALESIRARPLLGTGPGGFAADFVRARLAAEERHHRRLVHRSSSAHFDNAHCDPLTVAAETGVPAAVALAAALAALLAGLAGAVRRERVEPREGVPAEALLASLASILVLALANFPIQIVSVSGPFALLAGLAFARAGGAFAPRRGAATAGLAAAALLLAAGAAARLASSRALARSEAVLASASGSQGSSLAALLDDALSRARLAERLRPRSARAHLAAGSVLAARADLDGATAEMERSRLLEERAETLLNLGRLAVATGRLEEARPFFLRAVWIQPRLLEAVPPAGDPDAVHAAVSAIEVALAQGARTPSAPPPLRPR